MNSTEMLKVANDLNQLLPVLYAIAYVSLGGMCLGILSTFRKG